ncbi:MAG: fructose-1,6-bisphosphatase II, partial [Psychromonas sp.]
ALDKPLGQLTVATLAKPRHDRIIKEMQGLGVRVFAIPDGDVAISVLACMPDNQVDVLYCIGGAPEGVISAAVVRALDGNMQARLIPRPMVKGATEENIRIGAEETARCEAVGIEVNKILKLEDLVKNDNIIFSATGITKGDLVEGVTVDGRLATTETLLVRGKSRTIRRIRSTHYLDRKDRRLKDIIL